MLIKPAQQLIEKSRQESVTYPMLRFPENLGAHAMVMSFKEYQYDENGGLVNSVSEIPRGAIVLPVPTNLTDSFNVNISGQELGIRGKITAGTTNTITSTNASQLGEDAAASVGGFFNKVATLNGEELKKDSAVVADFSRYMLRDTLASFGLNTAFSVGRGTVINPHMAVAFEGMQLKNHSFTWKLSPKNSSESDSLRSIQNYLRRSALPSYEDSDGSTGFLSRSIFKYPKVVDIFFVGLDQEYYYYFKRCMISNFSINYAPTGQHAILKGGRPSIVEMAIELLETQVHTAEDYEDT